MTKKTDMEQDFQRLFEFLTQRTGLRVSEDREASLRDGIQRSMSRAGIRDVETFLSRVQLDQTAFDELMAEVTVGETYFYREPAHFEALRSVILPDLRRRKGGDHVMRLWSAGCSTGEEAWTLAMLCAQMGSDTQARILATDISRESLQKAQAGVYRQWSLRGPSYDFAQSYLRETADGWCIANSLRQSVNFEYLNLALDSYPSLTTGTWGCDVILCRNVLIYFDQETVAAVLRRLYEALCPGGWLILASTDPSALQHAPFELLEAGKSLVYRRPEMGLLEPICQKRPETGLDDSWVFDEPESEPGLIDSTIIRSGDLTIQEAQDAYRLGDYVRVRALTEKCQHHPVAAALLVRTVAVQDTAEAERVCATTVEQHPTSEELHFLHGLLLLELDRHQDAELAVRRVLFLDRNLAIGHFTMGLIQQRAGNHESARRAFRNARQICERLPPNSIVTLSDGESAGRLAQMATQHLAMLQASGNSVSQ